MFPDYGPEVGLTNTAAEYPGLVSSPCHTASLQSGLLHQGITIQSSFAHLDYSYRGKAKKTRKRFRSHWHTSGGLTFFQFRQNF